MHQSSLTTRRRKTCISWSVGELRALAVRSTRGPLLLIIIMVSTDLQVCQLSRDLLVTCKLQTWSKGKAVPSEALNSVQSPNSRATITHRGQELLRQARKAKFLQPSTAQSTTLWVVHPMLNINGCNIHLNKKQADKEAKCKLYSMRSPLIGVSHRLRCNSWSKKVVLSRLKKLAIYSREQIIWVLLVSLASQKTTVAYITLMIGQLAPIQRRTLTTICHLVRWNKTSKDQWSPCLQVIMRIKTTISRLTHQHRRLQCTSWSLAHMLRLCLETNRQAKALVWNTVQASEYLRPAQVAQTRDEIYLTKTAALSTIMVSLQRDPKLSLDHSLVNRLKKELRKRT